MTATFDTDGPRTTLRFERELGHDTERVWRAVTDPAELREWFPSEVIYEQRLGAPMTFDFGGKHGIEPMPGEVLEWDPPRAFAFAWGEDELRFELQPLGDRTRLVFTHAFSHEPGKTARDAAGWESCFEAFDAVLDGAPKPEPSWASHHERYLREFGDLTVDDHPVRLEGPLRAVDGRAAISVTYDEEPRVLIVRDAGQAFADGAAVQVHTGTVEEPGAPVAAGTLRDPLA
jgi:uncharacterized protein YndB with AHSA1/START domain